jgi:hypothetical protein
MGFMTGDLPPVDVETFAGRPYFERIRVLATHWAEYGFGTPKMVHAIYIAKLLVLYVLGGVLVATATSGLGPFWHMSAWWSQAIHLPKARPLDRPAGDARVGGLVGAHGRPLQAHDRRLPLLG